MSAFQYILHLQKFSIYTLIFLTLYTSFNIIPSIFNNNEEKLQNLINLIQNPSLHQCDMACANSCLIIGTTEDSFKGCLARCNCAYQKYTPAEIIENNQYIKSYIKFYLFFVSLALLISFAYLNRNYIRYYWYKRYTNNEQAESLLADYYINKIN
jgi:hypothetical protein